MANSIVLRVRDPNGGWIQNFHLGGWKMRDENNRSWIPMTVNNTRIVNPDYDSTDPSSPKWLSPVDPRQGGAQNAY